MARAHCSCVIAPGSGSERANSTLMSYCARVLAMRNALRCASASSITVTVEPFRTSASNITCDSSNDDPNSGTALSPHFNASNGPSQITIGLAKSNASSLNTIALAGTGGFVYLGNQRPVARATQKFSSPS